MVVSTKNRMVSADTPPMGRIWQRSTLVVGTMLVVMAMTLFLGLQDSSFLLTPGSKICSLFGVSVVPATTSSLLSDNGWEQPQSNNLTQQTTSSSRHRMLAADCENQCKDPTFKDLSYFQNQDMLNPTAMLQRLKQQRAQWVNKRLKTDYGAAVYTDMFEPTEEVLVNPATNTTAQQKVSIGRHRIFADPNTFPDPKKPNLENLAAAADGGVAWSRLVRKFQIKVLQIRLAILEERKNAKGICLEECSAAATNEDGSRYLRQMADSGAARSLKYQPSNGLYSKFTWVTGGHSASAGHGNLFRESYTANMGRALESQLAAIGIDFTAKNYAMGGTECAEEVALCMNSIFGKDIDAISWDYGMTDGHTLWKMTMYAYKAAGISRLGRPHSQPGNIAYRPAFFAIHQGGDYNLVVKSLGEVGMTALAYNDHYMKQVLEAVPDMMGKSDKEIEMVPKYVQHLKCDNKIEKGDPGCDEFKFNHSLCEKRKYQTSWHPGWKYHALVGNLMAVTLLDALEDALQELIELEKAEEPPKDESVEDAQKRLQQQLQQLDKAERQDYDHIFNFPFPKELVPHLNKFWEGDKMEHMTDMEIEPFFKQVSFCHTALLPAEIRFQGYLTENFTSTGTIMEQRYEEGVNQNEIFAMENPNPRWNQEPIAYVDPKPEKANQMALVKDANGRQQCDEYVNLDFKDYWMVTSIQGKRTLTLPNKSEKQYYNEFDAKKTRGWILACLASCDWGKCHAKDLHYYFGWQPRTFGRGAVPPSEEEVEKLGKAEIKINGVLVTEASDMHKCFALKNNKGHVWQPDANGQYEISVEIKKNDGWSFLQFSSFIFI